uniref:Uncharacterized protein n=1 Tax=Anguilla anguilla TaxID=7936 RepID=A0A0E9PT38_ANGAN
MLYLWYIIHRILYFHIKLFFFLVSTPSLFFVVHMWKKKSVR